MELQNRAEIIEPKGRGTWYSVRLGNETWKRVAQKREQAEAFAASVERRFGHVKGLGQEGGE